MKDRVNVLCIGAGYVGGPTMAVIADRCPHVTVNVVDINAARIRAWQTDDLPIFEPGLLEVVKRARGRNLFFSTDIEAGIAAADIIFVSVNTPTKTFGEGAGRAADLQYWEKTARQILACSTGNKIVVEKSTLPVRTAEAMDRILNSNTRGLRFEVLSNPEFLAEGTAVKDLELPDRVLVGSHETPEGIRARTAVADIYATWVPRERIIRVEPVERRTVEARRQRVPGAAGLLDQRDLGAVRADRGRRGRGRLRDRVRSRIGPRFLKASVGFGGSCFKKDILNLVYIAQSHGLDEVARYWEAVVRMNEWQETRFVRRMLATMFNTVAGKRIALFGFAFKAETGDTRESPALEVTRQLAAERAHLVITDPKALDNARIDTAGLEGSIAFEPDPYAAARGAHAIAVLTEWNLYRDLDWARLLASMERPAFVFDGRNILDHQRLFDLGFNVFAIGKRPLRHV